MDFLKEYSPSISGFQYYQWIENLLPTGDLSDPQSVDKTATEVKASKQRKYKRVTAIRENPMDCLENFVAGIVFYEGMNIRGYEFLCTFPLLQIIRSPSRIQRFSARIILRLIGMKRQGHPTGYDREEYTAKKNLKWSVVSILLPDYVV